MRAARFQCSELLVSAEVEKSVGGGTTQQSVGKQQVFLLRRGGFGPEKIDSQEVAGLLYYCKNSPLSSAACGLL